MDASLLKQSRELHAENAKLNKMYAELALVHPALYVVVAKILQPLRIRLNWLSRS